jgi:murein DD-endopeptidase MepM/ murein hydrolase activator NlpD
MSIISMDFPHPLNPDSNNLSDYLNPNRNFNPNKTVHPVTGMKKRHEGNDYYTRNANGKATEGLPVYAVADGEVSITRQDNGGVWKLDSTQS